MRKLVLASTSQFRHALLERFGYPFDVARPDFDETPLADESPYALVKRLAQGKARAAALQHPDALIIGCDQVAVLDEAAVGKPGNRTNAIAQLKAASGRNVEFLTGICVFDSRSNHAQCEVEPFSVEFRDLTESEIETYIDREQPFGCCGSFKSEGLGIALFERMIGDDPTALVGLPLIKLYAMLRKFDIDILSGSSRQ